MDRNVKRTLVRQDRRRLDGQAGPASRRQLKFYSVVRDSRSSLSRDLEAEKQQWRYERTTDPKGYDPLPTLETTCRTVNSSTTRCFDWCARNRFSIKHNKTRDCAGTATWCEKWDVKETCK
ncbi:hypothetical protein DINM_002100 [Dirofilaria immitis]|nr:hypothetical protein [Dirofilaria immitis]